MCAPDRESPSRKMPLLKRKMETRMTVKSETNKPRQSHLLLINSTLSLRRIDPRTQTWPARASRRRRGMISTAFNSCPAETSLTQTTSLSSLKSKKNRSAWSNWPLRSRNPSLSASLQNVTAAAICARKEARSVATRTTACSTNSDVCPLSHRKSEKYPTKPRSRRSRTLKQCSTS